MWAAMGGHTHTVEALARAGADLNIGIYEVIFEW